MMQESREKVFKIILCGAQGVGKTSIITRYMEGQYKQDYFSTIGIDFKLHNLTVGTTKLKLQIWDTAGQERFQSITSIHFKGANGCVCVADLTNKQSLKSCKYYLDSAIKQYGINKNAVFLVGNKTDAEQKQDITKEQLQSLVTEFQISSMRCSAKTGNGINKLFQDMTARLLQDSKEQNMIHQTINPKISFDRESKKCGC